MLTDPDILLLKLALERELVDAVGHRRVLESVRAAGAAGSVGRALRQAGVAGERVGELAEVVAAAGRDPSGQGQILARSDLEDAIVARALERSKMLDPEKLERARSEQKGLSKTGELLALTEVLVRRRWLEVPQAVELRRRARERVATCPRCHRHYIVEPAQAQEGRYKCRECAVQLKGGLGSPSAVDVARGLPPERPPPPIEASQMVSVSPESMAQLKAAREAGMRAEADRLAQQRSLASGTREAAASATHPAIERGRDPTMSALDLAARGAGAPAAPPRRQPAPPVSPASARPAVSGTAASLRPVAPAATPPPPPASPGHAIPDRTQRADSDTLTDEDSVKIPGFVPPTPPRSPSPDAARGATARASERLPTQSGSRKGVGGAATTPTPPARDAKEQPETARWESVHDKVDASVASVAAVATFGEYEILNEVARGGMGIVYRARRKGAQKILALKVLISGVDATEDQVNRFEREGEAARRIKHPGVVRIYDAGRHEGYHYIAMEFVEGKTLESLLAKGALEPRRSARVIRDLALAVEHIHKAEIVHRDLKPGNIILNDADDPKLIDFGLAKAIDRREKLTRSGAAVGTPYYMPPEQVKGEADKLGPWSDVYALGAILFEMLSGEVPFKAENPIELYHKIASSELTLPSALREGLPDELVTIVAVCMEKRPEDRYQSAADLAADLDRFLANEPIQARRRSAVARAATSKLGLRVVAVAAMLVVAVVVASLVAWKIAKGSSGGQAARAHDLQQQGRKWLGAGKLEGARDSFEEAARLVPQDPSVEVDLARALASREPGAALAALERADKKGLRDADALDAQELLPLAQDPRFKGVQARVRERR